MSIFTVVRYVVKPDKRAEFISCMRKIFRYVEENPRKFEEWKSFKLFTQMSFDIMGEYIELWEFEDMAHFERCKDRLSGDEGWTRLLREIALLIDPATFSMNIWEAVQISPQ